jgi:hypothetical protein
MNESKSQNYLAGRVVLISGGCFLGTSESWG